MGRHRSPRMCDCGCIAATHGRDIISMQLIWWNLHPWFRVISAKRFTRNTLYACTVQYVTFIVQTVRILKLITNAASPKFRTYIFVTWMPAYETQNVEGLWFKVSVEQWRMKQCSPDRGGMIINIERIVSRWCMMMFTSLTMPAHKNWCLIQLSLQSERSS